ncbi:membrane protein insertion efficiency factor YidD [Kitasatospora brasiliensis]|uniref:membrane protein insertion efficiency factor YidD n=1 Tax=Kitasatospora brasiliensis TaxID=3058040 RepID=UPI00292D34BE|nr:membrane protein insertion efficiency factor YidD [Kitasatospora sp. K002]
MSDPTPDLGANVPPIRPERAWWWLPASERLRRRKQRQVWEGYRKDEHAKSRRRKHLRNDGAECCADGCCEFADPCLIALIPVMMASGLRFALAGVRGRRTADPSAPVPSGFAAGVLYGAVRHYRTEVSPRRPACCPYTPSCSTYAVRALHRHGALRGARLTVGRLLRCRPGAGGADPVPPR